MRCVLQPFSMPPARLLSSAVALLLWTASAVDCQPPVADALEEERPVVLLVTIEGWSSVPAEVPDAWRSIGAGNSWQGLDLLADSTDPRRALLSLLTGIPAVRLDPLVGPGVSRTRALTIPARLLTREQRVLIRVEGRRRSFGQLHRLVPAFRPLRQLRNTIREMTSEVPPFTWIGLSNLAGGARPPMIDRVGRLLEGLASVNALERALVVILVSGSEEHRAFVRSPDSEVESSSVPERSSLSAAGATMLSQLGLEPAPSASMTMSMPVSAVIQELHAEGVRSGLRAVGVDHRVEATWDGTEEAMLSCFHRGAAACSWQRSGTHRERLDLLESAVLVELEKLVSLTQK